MRRINITITILLISFIFAGCAKQISNSDEVKEISINSAKAYINKVNKNNFAAIRDIDKIREIPSIDETLNSSSILGTIKFGRYEQDNNVDNGAEDIEWIILDTDKDNINKHFLVSKYILDYKKFDSGDKELELYCRSDIRYFLNSYFYKKAFNDDEKKYILDTKLSETEYVLQENRSVTSNNKKEALIYYDKVFLTRNTEFPMFFLDEFHTIATDYAKAKNIYVYDKNDRDYNKWKNNLTTGISPFYYRRWNINSGIYGTDIESEINIASGIRPAMWVDFSENIKMQEAIKSIVTYDDIRDLFYQKQNLVKFGRNSQEWLVCKKDGDKALLRLYNPIDGEKFDGNGVLSGFSWEKSKVRKYLNEDFYNTTFSNEEKKRIINTELENSIYENGKTNIQITKDNVFLLNENENGNYEECRYVESYDIMIESCRKKTGDDYYTYYKKRNNNSGELLVYDKNEDDVKEMYLLPMIWVNMYEE